jgi:hypothetical protein
VGATAADVLLSIGVFVGVPAAVFVVLVVRELRRLRAARRQWQEEDICVSQEGFAPGPPLESLQVEVSVTHRPRHAAPLSAGHPVLRVWRRIHGARRR